MWAACLHAGTKQHVKGITAPPRMTRLWPVDIARSTIKPRPRNRTVSANPCSVFSQQCRWRQTNLECVYPWWLADAANMGVHPICHGERVSSTNNGQVKWFRDNHTAHCETHEIPWAPTQYSIQTQQSLTMPTTTQ